MRHSIGFYDAHKYKSNGYHKQEKFFLIQEWKSFYPFRKGTLVLKTSFQTKNIPHCSR